MTNYDITTLEGSLLNVGQIITTNLKMRGISKASINDGLTTLANRIADIPYNSGYIQIFEDDCVSIEKLNEYGPVYILTSDAVDATLTYDDGMNAYKIESEGGSLAFPINCLNGEKKLKIEAEFYLPSTSHSFTTTGLQVIGTNHTSWGMCNSKAENGFGGYIYKDNAWIRNFTDKTPSITDEWVKFTLIIDDKIVIYYFEKSDGTLLYMGLNNLDLVIGGTYFDTISDRKYGLAIGWNSSDCIAYIRNIKVYRKLDLIPTITLTSNKNILSSYHNETATLTITHDGGNGKTVEIYNNITGIKVGDATDNEDGTYTYIYESSGEGDISLIAISDNIKSNSISIEDCYWYDEATTNNNHSSDYGNFGSAPTLECNSDGMKVSTTTGERWAKIPVLIQTDGDFELTYTITEWGGVDVNNVDLATGSGSSRHFVSSVTKNSSVDDWKYGLNGSLTNTFSQEKLNINDKIKIKRVSGLISYYVNDVLKVSNINQNHNGYIAFETYQDGRWTRYKDIKLKKTKSSNDKNPTTLNELIYFNRSNCAVDGSHTYNISYDKNNDKLTIYSNTGWRGFFKPLTINSNFEIEYDVKVSTGNRFVCIIGTNSLTGDATQNIMQIYRDVGNVYYGIGRDSSYSQVSNTIDFSTTRKVKFKYENGTAYIYVDNTLIHSNSVDSQIETFFGFDKWGGGNIEVSNTKLTIL